MRRLCAIVAAFALFAPSAHASAGGLEPSSRPECESGDAPLFAGGGTNLTNGLFFPGTAVYDGEDFQGVPYQIEQGCDVMFYNLDYAPLTNGHRIVSFKRTKTKKSRSRPLFFSRFVAGPDKARMKTRHLEPGVYVYFCSVHTTMYGKIEIVKG
ncbi:MAG: cupredoxin domain-containing protein [Actinomycetota bacterium]